MRIIQEEQPVVVEGYVTRGGGMDFKVTLAPGERVRTGTPLKRTPEGFRVDHEGTATICFAANQGGAGEEVTTWREMVLSFTKRQKGWYCGLAMAFKDVDDYGTCIFQPKEGGPFTAISDNAIVLTPPRTLQMTLQPPAPPPVEEKVATPATAH